MTTIDTRTIPPEIAALAAGAGIGEPVGFWTETEQTSNEPCLRGCLAPGSSPHFHTRTVGWTLIGTTGALTVDTNGVGVRVRSIHPFPEEDA